MNLDDDVAREVDRLRRERGLSLSAAINELVRTGMLATGVEYRYEHPSRSMGALVDLSNVAEVLDLLDHSESAQGSPRAS